MSPIRTFADADELARTAASEWLANLASTTRQPRPWCVAISGGRIAHALFRSVVEQGTERRELFNSVHFFWADERCVPPDNPESNFKIAQELLFHPLRIPAHQIHRIRGEDSPEEAAEHASAELRRVAQIQGGTQPVLDLILLGVGEDGHVASLFPGHPEHWSEDVVFHSVRHSPKPPPERVTLSFATIAAARMIRVLASGSGKEQALRESVNMSSRTPLGRLVERRPDTVILTDIRLDSFGESDRRGA